MPEVISIPAAFDVDQWIATQGRLSFIIALERAMAIERPHDVPLGMPCPEALRLATAVISRRYVLPETMQNPQVRSDCMRLAYLIQAFGLAHERGRYPISQSEMSNDVRQLLKSKTCVVTSS